MRNLGTNPVLGFASAMQKELDENSHKGTWRVRQQSCSPEALLKRLKEETTEIESAIALNQPVEEIIAECADVGNFAMMIADNYK
jgi:NTP pyrophosphatase (non-canonical NTP hydrolase)